MKYRTILNRILIDPDKRDDIDYKTVNHPDGTKGKLWIPKRSLESEYIRGTVVAAGEGAIADDGRLIKMSVKVGDRVVLQPPLRELDGYLVATEMDVMAIENVEKKDAT